MGTPPSERGITRRQLLAGATLLSPLAASACTSEAAEREKIKATAYAQSTAQAAPGRPRPTEQPAPAPTVVRQVTSAPTEQAIGQGFTRYRSVNYPYQIDYPISWSVQSANVGGRRVDIYLGKTNQVSISRETRTPFQNNINIFAEPITGQPRLEDYKNLVASQTKQALNPDRFSEQFLPKALDGNDVWVIEAYKLVGTIRVTSAITIRKGQGWQITLSEATGTNLAREDSNLFSRIMGSFKFLS